MVSLGIPYLFWNTVTAVVFIMLNSIGGEVIKFSINNAIECIFFHKYNGPFWYIGYLIIYSITAPLLSFVFRNKKLCYLMVCIFVVAYFVCPSIFAWYIFYYIGASITVIDNKLATSRNNGTGIWAATIVFLILQIYRIASYNADLSFEDARMTFAYKIYELISPILLWFVFDWIPFERIKLIDAEKHTFFIYSLHYIIVSIACSTTVEHIIHLPTSSIGYAVTCFVLIPILIYVMLTLTSIITKRVFPKFHYFITGGR